MNSTKRRAMAAAGALRPHETRANLGQIFKAKMDTSYLNRLDGQKNDLRKAGARHSVADMEHLKAAHDICAKSGASCGKNAADNSGSAIQQIHDHLAILGPGICRGNPGLPLTNDAMRPIQPAVTSSPIVDGMDMQASDRARALMKGVELGAILKNNGEIDDAATLIKAAQQHPQPLWRR